MKPLHKWSNEKFNGTSKKPTGEIEMGAEVLIVSKEFSGSKIKNSIAPALAVRLRNGERGEK